MRPVAAEWFYAGGLTDRHDEAKSRFSKFCEKLQFCEKPPPLPIKTVNQHSECEIIMSQCTEDKTHMHSLTIA